MTTISWGADNKELDKGEISNTDSHQRASCSVVVKVHEFDKLFLVHVHDAKQVADDNPSTTTDSGVFLEKSHGA